MAKLKLNDPEVFISYFEGIASKVKLLSHSDEECHYFPADIYELGGAFRAKLNSPGMISSCLRSNLKDGGSWVKETVYGVLWIIVHQEKTMEKLEVLKTARQITNQVLAKVKKDRDDGILLNFSFDDVYISQEDNIAGEPWHGYRVEFPLPVAATTDFNYDADNYFD